MSARLGYVTIKKNKSRSRRAGLLFPVGRIHRLCRKGPWVGSRIGAGAPVYLAAVMEYLAAELLEQAGLVARFGRTGRISPRHIKMAVKRDQELDMLCKGVVMAGGSEEVEKEKSIKLLKADMAGDLRVPTYQSVMGQEMRKKVKGKDSGGKKKSQYDRGTAMTQDIMVDLTEVSREQVIDLTDKNPKKSRGIDKEVQRSNKKHKKAQEKISQTIDLTGGRDVSRIQSFDDELLLVELRHDKSRKGGHVEAEKQPRKAGGGESAIIPALLESCNEAREEVRKVFSFEDEIRRIDRRHEKKLKTVGDCLPNKQDRGSSSSSSGKNRKDSSVKSGQDVRMTDRFREEKKRIDKKYKVRNRKHGFTGEDVNNVKSFVNLINDVRK